MSSETSLLLGQGGQCRGALWCAAANNGRRGRHCGQRTGLRPSQVPPTAELAPLPQYSLGTWDTPGWAGLQPSAKILMPDEQINRFVSSLTHFTWQKDNSPNAMSSDPAPFQSQLKM